MHRPQVLNAMNSSASSIRRVEHVLLASISHSITTYTSTIRVTQKVAQNAPRECSMMRRMPEVNSGANVKVGSLETKSGSRGIAAKEGAEDDAD